MTFAGDTVRPALAAYHELAVGAYGSNHERPVAVKTRYDPANVFRHNQNIVPAPSNGRAAY
jgi:Berberine and berberine like